MSKSKLIKRILLGLLFTLGTVVIVLAALLMGGIFFSEEISTGELTDSFEDYMAVYNEYPSMRDLPEGLEIVDSRCEISGNIFSYSLKIKNSNPALSEYSLQLYYSEAFMELKPKARNPFIREHSDEGLMLTAKEEKEFSITGTLAKGTDPEEFKSAMEYVYLEVIYGGKAGRVLLPVRIVE